MTFLKLTSIFSPKAFISICSFMFLFGCTKENDIPNFTSDSNLRLKSITSYTSVNPDQKFTNFFIYDGGNKLIKVESNSLGSSAEYSYDIEGRITKIGDYEYFYNSENDIYKIKNENLLTAAGTFDSTMVYYHQGKISSIVESFSDSYARTTYTSNNSYNNREQIRLSTKTQQRLIFETGNEYIMQQDKETFTYDTEGNIQKIISEYDLNSNSFLEIHREYSFDSYKNPITLLQKATGFNENGTVLYLNGIAYKNSEYLGGVLHYYKNNTVLYESIPQTSDDGFVHYRFKTNYTYNEFGYPIEAEEILTLVNQDLEYTNYTSWEYESYN